MSRASYPPVHLLSVRQLAPYGRVQGAYEAPARARPPADVRRVRQKGELPQGPPAEALYRRGLTFRAPEKRAEMCLQS